MAAMMLRSEPSSSAPLSRLPKVPDTARVPNKTLDADCTTYHNTAMIPFRVVFQPGASLYEQVVYAAKKALIAGQLLPGDPFPSVRALSTALRINPNTAHKVITQLLNEKLLEVMPGTGTVVAQPAEPSPGERANLLDNQVEQLAVEAKGLGLSLQEVTAALKAHWQRLEQRDVPTQPAAHQGERRRK